MKKKTENVVVLPKNKGFKGVWIPRGICEKQDLTIHEKYLLGVIFYLSISDQAKGYGGCYANNTYLAGVMATTKNAAAKMISDLRRKGWIRNVKSKNEMDKGKRVLVVVNAEKYFNEEDYKKISK